MAPLRFLPIALLLLGCPTDSVEETPTEPSEPTAEPSDSGRQLEPDPEDSRVALDRVDEPLVPEADLAILEPLQAVPGMQVFVRSRFGYGPERKTVELSPYLLSQTEIALWQWRECNEGSPEACPSLQARYEAAGLDSERSMTAVRLVGWAEADAYCRFHFQRYPLPQGYTGRLPTDAEWERAARGRQAPGRRFPHGDSLDPDMSTVHGTRLPDVGSDTQDRIINGLHDMVGGVQEWVLDAAGAGARPGDGRGQLPTTRKDPLQRPGSTSSLRAVRGGHLSSGSIDPSAYESLARTWVDAEELSPWRGFRCAVGPLAEPGSP